MYISEKYAQSSDLDLDHSVHAMKFMIADRDIKERRKPRAHQIVKHFDKHSLAQTFFFLGVPQRLDAVGLGRSTRCSTLVDIYHTRDRGPAHRASFLSLPA